MRVVQQLDARYEVTAVDLQSVELHVRTILQMDLAQLVKSRHDAAFWLENFYLRSHTASLRVTAGSPWLGD